MNAETDSRLVSSALAGSKEAAGALFDRHWGRVLQAAYAVTGEKSAAEDAAQEAFVRAFSRLDTLRSDRFGPWVCRIAINTAINGRRGRWRRAPLEAADHRPLWGDLPLPDAELGRALAALPEARRLPLVLRYWLDFTPPEIAEFLAIPLGTVHSRLARGLADLRESLEATRVY
jgi:RNA polymerase sigma-70 factor, ECF subfamily